MSNLGDYQKITTVSKAVGGSKNLVMLLLLAGVTGGKLVDIGIKEGKKFILSKHEEKRKQKEASEILYTAKKDAEDEQGLRFSKGDKIRVLENDADSILIEKIGDRSNPYYVSRDFLKCMSDFN
ncbi:MAG: hypothetical protein HFG29_09275 [Eubacterium sp.]|nr:hypothetical protein [Eubacterium sp.]